MVSLPKPGHARIAIVGLLLLLLLSFSSAMALTLPNPPDRSASTNNTNGALPGAQSFPGGVFLVDNGTTQHNESANEFVAEYLCINHPLTLTKQYETAIGESISGPLTPAQTSGLISAVNSVRPAHMVVLSIPIGGLDLGGNITYVQKEMLYNVTTYSVWVTTQQSGEQRVGYIVVSVPVEPQVVRSVTDMSGSSCDSYAMSKLGAGFNNGLSEVDSFYNAQNQLVNVTQPSAISLGSPLSAFSAPPAGGFAPIFIYGTIKVLSSAGVAGAASIRPGENATFVLPPGTYSTIADVTLFGIPFSVGSGTFSSPPGAAAAQFTVSLNSVYSIWYGLEIVALILLVAIILLIESRLHVSRALTHASKHFYRVLRSGWRKVWESEIR